MKIQEMRSSILHLNKKMDVGQQKTIVQPDEAIDHQAKTLECELDEPRWSIISFDRVEGSGLTYNQAVELLSVRDSLNIAGLCVVTDEAAASIIR